MAIHAALNRLASDIELMPPLRLLAKHVILIMDIYCFQLLEQAAEPFLLLPY